MIRKYTAITELTPEILHKVVHAHDKSAGNRYLLSL
ncbi:MAG: DUF4368 domain-containing protein [Ruminococcus sp.]